MLICYRGKDELIICENDRQVNRLLEQSLAAALPFIF